ncbi:hypothetical protein ACYSN1_21550 [Brucella sp. LJL56]
MARLITIMTCGFVAAAAFGSGVYVSRSIGTGGVAESNAQTETSASPSRNSGNLAPDNATTAITSVTKQAREWGIKSCEPQIRQVSQFLTANTIYSARSSKGNSAADQQMFSAAIVSKDRNTGLSSWSGISVAPVIAGGCNTSYRTVTFHIDDCEITRKKYYPSFTVKEDFGKLAELFTMENKNTSIYQIPTVGDACLTIKNQTFY